MTFGSGAGARSCTATTQASCTATCSISQVTVALGPQPITDSFAGDPADLPSSNTQRALVSAYSTGGSFVVGDSSDTGLITFWGAQWAKQNTPQRRTRTGQLQGLRGLHRPAAGARARKNYAGTSPITRQSGKKKTVHARHVHNDRLLDALDNQAQSALNVSPGARSYYDHQRHRGLGHRAALRQLANRLVGILHGCLKTDTCYDEAIAWPATINEDQQTAA